MTSSRDRSHITILYVEDEALIALDGKMMLEDLGFTDIRTASNLDEAFAIAKEGVNVALLDVNLGDGTNSLSLAESLLADGTPVVFASGYNSSENLSAHLDAPIVPKPFTQEMLAVALDQVT